MLVILNKLGDDDAVCTEVAQIDICDAVAIGLAKGDQFAHAGIGVVVWRVFRKVFVIGKEDGQVVLHLFVSDSSTDGMDRQ